MEINQEEKKACKWTRLAETFFLVVILFVVLMIIGMSIAEDHLSREISFIIGIFALAVLIILFILTLLFGVLGIISIIKSKGRFKGLLKSITLILISFLIVSVLVSDFYVPYLISKNENEIGKLNWGVKKVEPVIIQEEAVMDKLKAGDKAPAFTLLDQDGNNVSLALFKGTLLF